MRSTKMPSNYNKKDNGNWSMDELFLFNLDSLIKRYIEADFQNDFESMYKSLLHMETLSSPKIDHDDIEKNLEWLQRAIQNVNIFDDNGNIIGVNGQNKASVQDVMTRTFRLILSRLEEANIYTKGRKDPGKAMGNFLGS